MWSRDVEDPDHRLITAAGGSPRRLIQLGNQLMEVWERSGETKLTQEHFREIGVL